MYKIKKISLGAFLICLITAAINVAARDFTMTEYDQLFVAAKKIQKEEIDPLQLKGKLIGKAIHILIMEGYDCGRIAPLPGFDEHIGMSCNKERAEKSCSSSAAILHPDYNKVHGFLSVKEAMEIELNSIDVGCFHPNYLPMEYVVYQADAEKKLKDAFDNYALNGLNAQQAQEKLLDNHFMCGFDFDNLQKPNMRCSKIEPIQFCHDAIITIKIDWSSPIKDKSDVFEMLESSTVKKIESHCKIRTLQSNSQKGF